MKAQSGTTTQTPFRVIVWTVVLMGSTLLSTIETQDRRRRPRKNLETINNLKNLALAIHNAATLDAGRLPRTMREPASRSWRTQILQYVDRADLQREYQPDQPWDSDSNAELARTHLNVFDSPDGRRGMNPGQEWAPSDYGMISGPGTVQPGDRAVTLDKIAAGDGLGSTLLLGECVGLKLAWAEPRDPHIEREQIGIERVGRDQTSTSLLSTSSSAPAVAFTDGSARQLNPKIDPKILKALCTIDGDEPINQHDYIN